MGISPKNAPKIIPNVIDDVDFAINEQRIQYGECNNHAPFWAISTPLLVFNIEYPPHSAKTWTEANAVKKCKYSINLDYPYLFTDLKNYPTVTCGVSRCTSSGLVPAVAKAGLVIPPGCVDAS